MRFLKKKVFGKMAVMPPQHESSDEERFMPPPVIEVKPVIQAKPAPILKPATKAVNTQPAKKVTIKKEFLEQIHTSVMPMGSTMPMGGSAQSMMADAQSLAGTNPNTKNIVKNYGKAMCSFAAADMSFQYLLPLAKRENIKTDRFREYFRCKKELVGSIESFRNLYIEDDTDNEEIKAFKRVFKEISMIFIKFFSVNWIFNGKLTQKQAHLKYRFKMLRRIKNPELFTYLKG